MVGTKSFIKEIAESTLVGEALKKSLDYPTYRELIRKQVDEGRGADRAQDVALLPAADPDQDPQ